MSAAQQCVVVKLGTSVLTAGTSYLNRPRLIELVQQCAELRQQGHQLILVSSGAMAAGKEQLGFPQLPPHVPAKQMLSAVGQLKLMGLYQQYFDIYGLRVGQMLLTRADLQHRRRFLNARLTLQALLENGIIPIVNENDTVTAEEIRVGDNDNLSAMVASLAEADLLIMLTDIPGLFTADPRQHAGATLIQEVHQIDEALRTLAGDSSSGLGTGGMATKLQAAETALAGGTTVIIADGSTPDVLPRLLRGEALGTRFISKISRLESRKRWLLAGYKAGCRVVVDDGASHALRQRGKSLLPAGICAVEGDFERGDTIGIVTLAGREFARGLVRYAAADIRIIQGRHSSAIEQLLGYEYGKAVIHRNDMVFL